MLLLFIIAAVILIPISSALQQAADTAPVLTRGDTQSEPDKSADIWEIMMGAYTKMRRAGVSCRPWVSSCVDAIERGRECPVDVAILAIRKTLEEISGTRYERMVSSDLESAIEVLRGI